MVNILQAAFQINFQLNKCFGIIINPLSRGLDYSDKLSLKQLDIFFWNVSLFNNIVPYKCNISV